MTMKCPDWLSDRVLLYPLGKLKGRKMKIFFNVERYQESLGAWEIIVGGAEELQPAISAFQEIKAEHPNWTIRLVQVLEYCDPENASA